MSLILFGGSYLASCGVVKRDVIAKVDHLKRDSYETVEKVKSRHPKHKHPVSGVFHLQAVHNQDQQVPGYSYQHENT